MNIEKKNLDNSKLEIYVSLSFEEFAPYITKGVNALSKQIKIEGFRPGKAPYELLEQKVGVLSIVEEAANIAIRKTLDNILQENLDGRTIVSQPRVEILKLAPDNPFEYKIIVSLSPKLELGEYKNLKIEKEKAVLNEKDIEKTLEEIAEMRVKEKDSTKPAKKGDKVIMDLNLSIDKVPIDGGQAKDLSVILGKEIMVAGFDKNILGLKVGDKKEFSLPYPKDHHQDNLRGKLVEFSVKINSMLNRELPEINDDFAKSMNFKDLEDLKEVIKGNILADKEHKAEIRTEEKMIDALFKNTKFDDIPSEMLDNELEHMVLELENNISSQGGNFVDYLKHLNKTKDELKLEMSPNALRRIKMFLLIKELSLVEKIEVSQDELDKKLKELKERFANDAKSIEKLSDPAYIPHLKGLLLNELVMKKLKEWNYVDTKPQQKS